VKVVGYMQFHQMSGFILERNMSLCLVHFSLLFMIPLLCYANFTYAVDLAQHNPNCKAVKSMSGFCENLIGSLCKLRKTYREKLLYWCLRYDVNLVWTAFFMSCYLIVLRHFACPE